jgi:hypothetical protein
MARGCASEIKNMPPPDSRPSRRCAAIRNGNTPFQEITPKLDWRVVRSVALTAAAIQMQGLLPDPASRCSAGAVIEVVAILVDFGSPRRGEDRAQGT